MSPEVVLFLLRLVSAALLLAFLGAIAWLIYKDIQVTSALVADRQRQYGTLTVVAGTQDSPAVGSKFPLMPVTSIGRSSNNTLVLDDDYASSEHALVLLRGRRWWLEDLGSRNGTLLNDLPLESSAVVTAGDIITIGRTCLKIEL